MSYFPTMKNLYCFTFSFLFATILTGQIKISIDPHTSNSIKGNLELNRLKYFNLASAGNRFESKINDPKLVKKYLDDYQINFGRDLGMVSSKVRYSKSVIEDKNKPGYVDMDELKSRLKIDNSGSEEFKARWKNMDVAMHEGHNAYPDFMEQKSAPKYEKEKLPVNTEAASELAIGILKYGYNDYNRPITYEIVNEPHWSLLGQKSFAELHLAVHKKAKEENLKTMIGGPCYAVAYYYKRNYTSLNNFGKFIDNTNGALDFYSFHIYDYLKWDEKKKDFLGRVTTGLPLEGVLDALQNYTVNKYEKETPIVISEHGGYPSNEVKPRSIINEKLTNQLIGPRKPGFSYEMKRRSISDRLMTRSAVANTFTFMNNPHIIKKAVPFILLETVGWNPEYHATILTPKDFKKGNPWVESKKIDFYKLFAEIKGKRVLSYCEDPDIQYQTFIDGKDLYVALNNLSDKPEKINFEFTNSDFKKIIARRHGQNKDFTPYFKEEKISKINKFFLKAREAVVLKLTYNNPVEIKNAIDVQPYYSKTGNKLLKEGENADFPIIVPEYENAVNAILRISVGRETIDAGKKIKVVFNGKSLKVPMEDIAEYLQDDKCYGSTKIIKIDPKLLKENNIINVSFPDGKVGGIGSVVLRVGLREI